MVCNVSMYVVQGDIGSRIVFIVCIYVVYILCTNKALGRTGHCTDKLLTCTEHCANKQ